MGALSFFIVWEIVDLFHSGYRDYTSIFPIAVPAVMMIGGYIFMKLPMFRFVDEVFDCDDYLLIRNGAQQEKILLKEITSVNYFFQRPLRVTITTRYDTGFGSEISFIPPTHWLFFKSPLIKDLKTRVQLQNDLAKPQN